MTEHRHQMVQESEGVKAGHRPQPQILVAAMIPRREMRPAPERDGPPSGGATGYSLAGDENAKGGGGGPGGFW